MCIRDSDVHIADVVRLRGGVRAEVFAYDVTDHLMTAHVTPVRGTVAPRASIEVRASSDVTFAASYGEGFRSPQGQPLAHLSDVPLALVRTGDVGARFTAGTHDELALNVSGFVSALSDDLVFEADEGTLESIGPTTRIGGSMHFTTHPLPWLRGLLSATYVRATLDHPMGAYTEALPYLPPLTMRVEASADEEVARIADQPFRVHGSVGFTFLSPRPLPYGDVARAVGLLDASVGVAWGNVDLTVDAFNVLDQRFAALEYAMPAQWTPTATRTDTPSRAFSTGAPLTVMATLAVRIE